MNDAITINGREVYIVSRERSRAPGTDGCIEAFAIRGIHYGWSLGTDVTISFPEETVRGRVGSTWTDHQELLTHIWVYHI